MISRSLHWERGLKLSRLPTQRDRGRRSLHWERGLKQVFAAFASSGAGSLPSLGAWIETFPASVWKIHAKVAPFIGSVD